MIPLTYILINFGQALWHRYLIGKNRLILSAQKIIEYSILSLLAGLTILILSGWQVVPLIFHLIAFCLLSRLAFYDIMLNLLRGKNWMYEGVIGKYKSFWDWLENQTGIPMIIFRLFYIALFIGYTLIYYL